MRVKELVSTLGSLESEVREVVVLNGDPSCGTKGIQDVYYDHKTKQIVIMVGCY